MQKLTLSRRHLLGATAAGISSAMFASNGLRADNAPTSANEEIGVGAIGLRYQGSVITEKASRYGQIVALCDVDRHVREQARAAFGSTPSIDEEYQNLLARPEVDVVLIATPDHWHAKMLIDACRAGKDVYIEKPMSLTIDEGKLMRQAVLETGRVVQVGSWQRSDHNFRLAAEMVRQGRIGELREVEVVLGKNVTGGPFLASSPPRHFNWNLWQGQTPDVPYIEERAHYTFRWWQEYSGGQLTDWGAHHVDIAQWGIGSSPIRVEGTARYPDIVDGYNVPIDFFVRYEFPGGVHMTIADNGRNGVMFTGTDGRIFANRGVVAGTPIDNLATHPLPREAFGLYDFDNLTRPERMGKLDAIINHMGNFFDCVRERRPTLSDIESQHRSVTTCHLGNISMRLGRPLTWDPESETFPDDSEANALLRREQRSGFEVV